MVDPNLLDQHDRALPSQPLGLAQPLGTRSPLGVSSTTIEQIFPVLQLSVEQSDRLSQHPDFYDEFGFFSEASTEAEAIQSQEVSPGAIPQIIQTSQASPESTTTENQTVQSEPEPKAGMTEILSLSIERSPLAPPAPLGDRPPLINVETLEAATRSESSEDFNNQPPLMAVEADQLQDDPSLQLTSLTQAPDVSESPVEFVQTTNMQPPVPQTDAVVQARTEPDVSESPVEFVQTTNMQPPVPQTDAVVQARTEPNLGTITNPVNPVNPVEAAAAIAPVEPSVNTASFIATDFATPQPTAPPDGLRSPTPEVTLQESASREIASEVTAQLEKPLSTLIDEEATTEAIQRDPASVPSVPESVPSIPELVPSVSERVVEALASPTNTASVQAPDSAPSQATDLLQTGSEEPNLAVSDRNVEDGSHPIRDRLVEPDSSVQLDSLLLAKPDDATTINGQPDLTEQPRSRAIAAQTTSPAGEAQAAIIPSEHTVRDEPPLQSSSLQAPLRAEPTPETPSSVIGESTAIAPSDTASDIASDTASDTLLRLTSDQTRSANLTPQSPSLSDISRLVPLDATALETSDKGVPTVAAPSEEPLSTSIDNGSATDTVPRDQTQNLPVSETVEAASTPRLPHLGPRQVPDDTPTQSVGHTVQSSTPFHALASTEPDTAPITDVSPEPQALESSAIALNPPTTLEAVQTAVSQVETPPAVSFVDEPLSLLPDVAIAQTLTTESSMSAQWEAMPETEGVTIQTRPLTTSITPLEHREGMASEEVNLQKVPVQHIPQSNGRATLVNFRTRSMSTGSAATLHHEVVWVSDSGNLADLSHIQTREQVSWSPAPREFGSDTTYSTEGQHQGLGTRSATIGEGADDHSIIPPGFKYALDADGSSSVWLMRQQYQYQENDSDWQDIQGAHYEISRWFERVGNDLIAYTAKRGITEAGGHRAMIRVPGFFGSPVQRKTRSSEPGIQFKQTQTDVEKRPASEQTQVDASTTLETQSIESIPIQRERAASTALIQSSHEETPNVLSSLSDEPPFQALPPLGQRQPLGISPASIASRLALSEQEQWSQIEPSAQIESSSNIAAALGNSVSDISLKPADSTPIQPLKPTALEGSMVPDTWSSLEDLLQQSSVAPSGARSWQDVASSLTDRSDADQSDTDRSNADFPELSRSDTDHLELPTEQSNGQAPDAFDRSTAGTAFNQSSETWISPKKLEPASLETSAKTPIQELSNQPPIDQADPRDQEDQLEQLAWKVYHQLRQRFAIEGERQGRVLLSYPPWAETIAPSSPKRFQAALSTNNMIELLSPTDAGLIQLTDAVYHRVRSRLELERERYGVQSRRHI